MMKILICDDEQQYVDELKIHIEKYMQSRFANFEIDTTNNPQTIVDSNEIYQHYFNNYSYKTVVKKGDLILTLSKKDGSSIEVFADDTLEYYLNNEAEVKVNYDGITELTNDLKKGDYLGIYSIYADDRLLYSKEIFLSEDVINRNSIIISLIIVITGFIGIISLKQKRS